MALQWRLRVEPKTSGRDATKADGGWLPHAVRIQQSPVGNMDVGA